MVKLFCAIVGEADRPFAVNIGGAESICALKKAIKAEKPDGLRNVDASNLELYLAKKGNAWLDIAEAVAVTLDGDRHPQGFDEMDPTLWIQNDKYFGKNNFQPREGQIHVLVVQLAASIRKQRRFKKMTPETSCLKLLDALARDISLWYDFDCEFGRYPTIGDVFRAVEKEG